MASARTPQNSEVRVRRSTPANLERLADCGQANRSATLPGRHTPGSGQRVPSSVPQETAPARTARFLLSLRHMATAAATATTGCPPGLLARRDQPAHGKPTDEPRPAVVPVNLLPLEASAASEGALTAPPRRRDAERGIRGDALSAPKATQRAASEAWTESLRQKALLGGVEGLGDGDLLNLVLHRVGTRADVGRMLQRLLVVTGGLGRMGRLSPQQLMECAQMTAPTAVVLASALELGRRSLLTELSGDRPDCGSFEAVAAWAQPRLGVLEHEEVWVLGLDGSSALKTLRRVARGGQHGCALTTRDVLRPVLMDGATAMVVVHNHPSGDATPSAEDTHMTRELARACEVVGIPLLDHVIVTRTEASSLLELGVLG